jgi:hypothetical protein
MHVSLGAGERGLADHYQQGIHGQRPASDPVMAATVASTTRDVFGRACRGLKVIRATDAS